MRIIPCLINNWVELLQNESDQSILKLLNDIQRWTICLLVYLEFFVPLENFHSYGDVTIASKGLRLCRVSDAQVTYARHSWPLSSGGSLTCQTHCDTDLPFIMVISENPWHSHLLPSVWQWNCHYLFLRLGFVPTGDRTPISRMREESSTSTPSRRSIVRSNFSLWNKFMNVRQFQNNKLNMAPTSLLKEGVYCFALVCLSVNLQTKRCPLNIFYYFCLKVAKLCTVVFPIPQAHNQIAINLFGFLLCENCFSSKWIVIFIA